jgi:hypothetical protein
MLSLETFKKTLGLQTLNFKKSKTGKLFADVPGVSLYLSAKADTKKPLFITECEATTGGKVMVICNQGWEATDFVL